MTWGNESSRRSVCVCVCVDAPDDDGDCFLRWRHVDIFAPPFSADLFCLNKSQWEAPRNGSQTASMIENPSPTHLSTTRASLSELSCSHAGRPFHGEARRPRASVRYSGVANFFTCIFRSQLRFLVLGRVNARAIFLKRLRARIFQIPPPQTTWLHTHSL